MKKNKNLTLKVYDSLIQLMLNYEIVPGQRMVFVDLAKQLKVSRTPVNNALAILAQEGYLDFVPHQGYSVHKITKKEAEDLYEIREILEIGFIGQAIRKMSDKKLEQIEKCMREYEAAIAQRVTRKMFILDTEFHCAIMDVTGNEQVSSRYRDICRKIFLRFRIEDLEVKRIEEIRDEHRSIFEALSLKDVELAKKQIGSHHKTSRKALFQIIFSKI